MKTITFKDGKCTSDPFDKTIFNGMDNTIVHIISDNHDEKDVAVAVCCYLSEVIGESIYPAGSLSPHKTTRTSIEGYLQIYFH